MRYFIFLFLLIIFSLLFNFALAGEINPPKPPESFDRIYQQFNERFFNPMKQIPKKIEDNFQSLIQSIENKAEQEKEEIKEGLKEKVKSKFRERIDSWLAPLKIKIQEGSKLLRVWMGKGIDWIKSLFK